MMGRTLVSAGELSLSYARLLAGRATTLWLSRPLSVSQHGQFSHPSLRGRYMSSDPCNQVHRLRLSVFDLGVYAFQTICITEGPKPASTAMGSRELAPRYYRQCQSAATSEVVKRRCPGL